MRRIAYVFLSAVTALVPCASARAANGYPHGPCASVRGVIAWAGDGRMTLLNGPSSTITVDDRLALRNQAAQGLYPGRSVTVYGFWSGGILYAAAVSEAD